MGERFTATSRAGLWPVEGLSEGSGALHETVSSLFPGPSCSAAGPSLGELEGSPEKAASYLTFHLMTTTPLTLGSVTFLMVHHRLFLGQSPLWRRPIAEQDS